MRHTFCRRDGYLIKFIRNHCSVTLVQIRKGIYVYQTKRLENNCFFFNIEENNINVFYIKIPQ